MTLIVLLISINTLLDMSNRLDLALQKPSTLTQQEYQYIREGLIVSKSSEGGLEGEKINAVVTLNLLVLDFLKEYTETNDNQYYREAVRYKIYADDLLHTITKK